jgi:hypothetical protein
MGLDLQPQVAFAKPQLRSRSAEPKQHHWPSLSPYPKSGIFPTPALMSNERLPLEVLDIGRLTTWRAESWPTGGGGLRKVFTDGRPAVQMD